MAHQALPRLSPTARPAETPRQFCSMPTTTYSQPAVRPRGIPQFLRPRNAMGGSMGEVPPTIKRVWWRNCGHCERFQTPHPILAYVFLNYSYNRMMSDDT